MIAFFSRLSTGVKMLLILTVALLPLGLIAILASIESAQMSRLRRNDDARMMASIAARRMSAEIGRASLDLRGVTAGLDYEPLTSVERMVRCRDGLARIGSAGPGYDLAIFTRSGRLVCKTRAFSGLALPRPDAVFATEVRLRPAAGLIQFESRSPAGDLYGVGEMRVAVLRAILASPDHPVHHGIVLRQEADTLIVTPFGSSPLARRLVVFSPVAGGQVVLQLVTDAVPIGALELLLALLPILMWVAAAVIGWLVVDRLIIRPLLLLQRGVSEYRPEDGPLIIPPLTTPAREIWALADAFRSVTERIGRHEAELAEGLARQTLLTREVHHRVKNNLQVVASLISIHARGVQDPAVAAAYASIQRRVDALSVVHRNHFAELEANRGVALRALIGELSANLRTTAPSDSGGFAISTDVIAAYCTQDVAVPVAFLLTEIVEIAMAADPDGKVKIVLEATNRPERALLSLTGAAPGDGLDRLDSVGTRFRRVIDGLSRQLRTKLSIDQAIGRYALEIPILPDENAAAAKT